MNTVRPSGREGHIDYRQPASTTGDVSSPPESALCARCVSLQEALQRIGQFAASHSGNDGADVCLGALYRIAEECEALTQAALLPPKSESVGALAASEKEIPGGEQGSPCGGEQA